MPAVFNHDREKVGVRIGSQVARLRGESDRAGNYSVRPRRPSRPKCGSAWVALRGASSFFGGLSTPICRPMRFACDFHRRDIPVGASPRAAAGFAALPRPGDRMAARRKMVNTIITKALNAMRICVCPERTAATNCQGSGHSISRPSQHSVTKSAAIARQKYQWLARWAACRSMCSTVRRPHRAAFVRGSLLLARDRHRAGQTMKAR